MARKIVWSIQALEEREMILKFWIEKNKSKVYSRKLFKTWNTYLELISEYPFIGSTSQVKNVRLKVIDKNYSIIYSVLPDEIFVISIWDNHKNPSKKRFGIN